MGRATRWLKSFFVIKSPTHHNQPNSDAGSGCRSSHMGGSGRDSGGICNNPATIPPNITASEAAWLNLYYMDKEQSKHAVTVAAAAAAAADAAVAAAQAAAAVVRLANNGRERWAAVKVQATFRGYLARKALRALKGLVKIQALVRGYLVRKQATATFHSMQALFRAQATIRSKRVHGLAYMGPHYPRPALSTRQSVEIFDDSGSEHTASLHSKRLSASFDSKIISVVDNSSPKIVEVDTGRPRCRPRRPNTSFSGFDANPFYHTPHQTRLSIPTWHDTNWGSTKDDFRSSTAQSTPRFTNCNRPHPPTTPTKSVGGEKCKNYMAKTQCFEAKVRSQSAPKQRPEPSPMSKKRNSISGVRMQLRSCSKSQEVVNFKNAVMGTLNKSLDQTIR